MSNPPEGIEETYDVLFGENKDAVEYLYKDYSYNELNKRIDEIIEYSSKTEMNIVSASVNDRTGKIEIGLAEEHYSDTVNMLSSVNSLQDCEINYYLEEYMIPQDSVNCGSDVYINTAFSIAAYGVYNGQQAVLTCGHSTEVNEIIKYQGNDLATVCLSQYSSEGVGDYSFAILDSDYVRTYNVGKTNHGVTVFDDVIMNPSEGTIVTKYGYVSGYTTLRVVDVDKRIYTTDGFYVCGLTKAEIISGSSNPGDSGGPYMSGNAFCGVHSGSGAAPNVYFTPYSIINNAGFTVYTGHDVDNWSYLNGSNHSGYCDICCETVIEPHTIVWSGVTGTCVLCSGNISVASVPEDEISIW